MGSSKIDEKTGTITYDDFSRITKGSHANMPHRTDAYLETDERGHIQASSLGGSNKACNVVPQSADLNHGAYYSMENGERTELKNGSTIRSEKIAFVSNQPRPDNFIVNDTITYPSGCTQKINLSFANMTNAQQESVNSESIVHTSDMIDGYSNPGDGLRSSMPSDEYADLMQHTDVSLPNISDNYQEHISISAQSQNESVWDFEVSDNVECYAGENNADWDYDCEVDTSSAEMDGMDDGVGVSSDDD